VKNFISIFICASMLMALVSRGLFAQQFDIGRFESDIRRSLDRGFIERETAIMPRDNTRDVRMEQLKPFYDMQAEILISQAAVDMLLKQRERAMEEENYRDFYLLTMQLNQILYSYLTNKYVETRLLGAATLLEQLKDGAITPEDAHKVYDFFESYLKDAGACAGPACDFIVTGAVILAHSRYFFKNEANLSLHGNIEVKTITPHEQNVQRRVALLKNVANRDFGSKEANATIITGLIYTLASLGTLQDVYEVARAGVEGHGSWVRKRLNSGTYDAKNDTAQIAAMNAVYELGPQALPVLEKFAFERHSLASQVHANINLMYTSAPLEKKEAAKKMLEFFYCHHAFNLPSQADMVLRREIAYAYGGSRRPEYVVSAGSRQCLVIYPDAPDPRIVTEEWTNIAMKEVAFMVAFTGIGNAIIKGARVAKHLSVIKYTASKRGISVAKFFRTGQLKTLPAFGERAASIEAATAKNTNVANAMRRGSQRAAEVSGAAPNNIAKAIPAEAGAAAQNVKTAGSNIRPAAIPNKAGPDPVKPVSIRKLPLHPSADSPPLTPLDDNTVRKMIFDRTSLPKPNLNGRYPSGLSVADENLLVEYLSEAFGHTPNYHINPYILANKSMSTAKKVNLMNFFETHPEAKKWIAQSINAKGGLPAMFYTRTLIHTPSYGASYITREMDTALKRLMVLSDPKKAYASNFTELKNLLGPFRDYNFDFGFKYNMEPKLRKGLTNKFKGIINMVEKEGARADPRKFNVLWRKGAQGKTDYINLENFFSQTVSTKYSKGNTPYFIVNSKYWTQLENEAIRQTSLFVKTPGQNLSWFRNPMQKARLHTATRGNPENYMTLDEYAAFSRGSDKPVRFGKKTVLGNDAAMDMNEVITSGQAKSKGIKFCSMEKKEGIYGTGEWSNYRNVERFDISYTTRQTDMPIFLDNQIQMARTEYALTHNTDNMIHLPSKMKTRKFFLDMPDRARALLSSKTELNLLSDAMPDIIATAKNRGGAAARWLAYNKYPPKFVNGQWLIDRRAVYLEKAISPRARPLFELKDLQTYKMTLMDLKKAPVRKAANLETTAIFEP
jgi:hypothetical protein